MLYAALLETPGTTTFSLPDVAAAAVRNVRLLGADGALEFVDDRGRLQVRVPDRLPVSQAHVLAIDGEADLVTREAEPTAPALLIDHADQFPGQMPTRPSQARLQNPPFRDVRVGRVHKS